MCSVISLILVTERSFLNSMRNGGDRIRELSREDAVRRRENAQIRRQEQEERNSQREEARRIRAVSYTHLAVYKRQALLRKDYAYKEKETLSSKE